MDIVELEEFLSRPDEAVIAAIKNLKGDIAILGAGGKMGPTLAMMLKRADRERRVYAISRFSDASLERRLKENDIDTIKCDLLDRSAYKKLPAVENVYYLAGMKFGATGNEPLTWAMNAYVPALVSEYFADSRLVIFSTGNVYPFTDAKSGGASEETLPGPIGEYAQSCLARERIFQYFSQKNKTPMTIIRLNYANEPRYGIIVDLTQKILKDEPIDLTMGFVNLIWQRDANSYIARAISIADSPPEILNVAGPETISVFELSKMIGRHISKEPRFVNNPADNALLSNAGKCFKLFGYPQMSLLEMVERITDWIKSGGQLLGKETKFQVRNGKF